ncbi:MAG: DUF4398 domain-containing protein [Gammaproteobacteria bacterium]|nr:DUF4398 domain-containing protein [Gammaproteobacteria bacterium]
MLKYRQSIKKFTVVTLAAGAVLLVTGCSTLQTQTQSFVTKASSTLDMANTAGAEKYAPKIMELANKNITLAKSALGENRYQDAQQYAEKSIVESERAGVESKKNERSSEISALREQIAKLMP